MYFSFAVGKYRRRHIGEHTVSNGYDVRQTGQIRLFNLQLSPNPIFVLNCSGKSDLVCHFCLGMSSGGAGTLVST